MAAGATTGGAVTTGTALAFRLMEGGNPEALSPDFRFILVTTGLLLGIGAGTIFAFMLSAPINDLWRRGVTAGIALFGSVLLGAAAAPADALLGPIGLALYAGVLILLSRKATLNAVKARSG